MPKEARWPFLKASAPQPTIGTIVDDAMTAIERDNPSLKGVLPKDFGRAGLDKQRLGQLINLVSDVALGSAADRAKDTLGRVYEYFLSQFASAEGKKGGQFYTPSCWSRCSRPTGIAGFVLANGSMSSNQSGEGEIRKAIIEADLVDCMVALPGQLFYSTQIPVCLWFLARDKSGHHSRGGNPGPFRDRRGETLFIDARKFGTMVDRVHRELTDDDLARIANTYHAWRGESVGAGLVPAPDRATGNVGAGLVPAPDRATGNVGAGLVPAPDRATGNVGAGLVPAPDRATTRVAPTEYRDIAGFCRSVPLDDIRKHGHVLTPGRYVGAEAVEDDGEPFEEKMKRLVAELRQQQAEAARLDAAIAANLKELGYG